jgi:CheY-like chemotaxis protein/glycine cleavage system H lipoate-binding protein
MVLMIIAVVLFIIVDIIIRIIIKKIQQARLKKDRALALDKGINLDYSHMAKTLKRVEVEAPKARILAVDDEEIVLDSFRKILVLDGYAIDTVQSGKEALGLIQKHNYDFVFTDLKMPEMDGIAVTKGVKHLRPDIDVIIITGYATVESAVECMQYGAMDYVQKPFTEDELLAFVKKSHIIRHDKIEKQLKPQVHVTRLSDMEHIGANEFSIPGGAFISEGHCWLTLDQKGTVQIGIDDFAKKMIGTITAIEFPDLGMEATTGQTLFSIIQGKDTIPFKTPLTGKIAKINNKLKKDPSELEFSCYGDSWICMLDAHNLDLELKDLKIGQGAVAFFQEEINHCCHLVNKMVDGHEKLCIGELQSLSESNRQQIIDRFFKRV